MRRTVNGPANQPTRREFIKFAASVTALALIKPAELLAEGPAKEVSNPLKSEKLPALLKDIKGTDAEKIKQLFELLKDKLKTVKSKYDDRPPRTVDETLAKGGDCTEFALVVLASLKHLGLEGGATIVHFKEAPENMDHMVAHASVYGNKIHIDPQAEKLGIIGDGKEYEKVSELTIEEAKGMYHRELGNHYFMKNKYDKAIEAFEQSLNFYEKDAYVHHKLGYLYQEKGKKSDDLEHKKKAYCHNKRSSELNPDNEKYKKNTAMAGFNYEVKLGEKSFNEGEYSEAKTHFENAIELGKGYVPKEHIEMIESYIKQCE